jgi:hypothetical protein
MENELLVTALAKVIADAVPPEMQKDIFSKALYDHLFYPKREGGSGPTCLEHAFQQALNKGVSEMAEKVLSDPENKKKLEDAFNQALEQILSDGSLVKKIADKMSYSLRY